MSEPIWGVQDKDDHWLCLMVEESIARNMFSNDRRAFLLCNNIRGDGKQCNIVDTKDQPREEPIPMILTCPVCNARHIDKHEFATKVHHTHACQHCGMVWRPAVVPTVGVQFLPDFKD